MKPRTEHPKKKNPSNLYHPKSIMKAQKLCMLASVFSAALFSMSTAQAADVTTEDVKVTASRVEQELMDVNMSVSVITADDIAHSEARTIGDLLKDVPGVQINSDGCQGMKRAQIRGEDSFRTLVMIDGQKIAEHKSMSGSPMLIDPSMVERIEVIKGPASVLYGSDAIGGAINIITKKGGNKPFEAEVSAGMDNASNGKTAAASIYGGISGWHYRLGLAHESGDNLRTPAGKAPYTEFSSFGANGYLAYDISENATVGMTLDHFDMDFMSGSMLPGYSNFFVNVPKWKRDKVGIFTDIKNLNEYLTRIRVDAFYQTSNKQMQNHIAVTGMPFMIDNFADNDLDQYGISIQTDWQLGENNYLVAGYEFNYDDLDATSSVLAVAPRNMGMGIHKGTYYTSSGIYQGSMSTHAVFASMESMLPYDLTLTYGARYTYVKTDMDKSYGVKTYAQGLNASKGPIVTSTPGSQHNDRVVFNAGISYSGIDDLVLRTLWSQGFRSPLLQERYIPSSMGNTSMGQILGNPDLKPETSDNFEIGARYQKGGFMLDTAAFLSLADDYIAAVSISPTEQQYDNMAEAKTFGIELSTSYQIGETGFTPYINGTWMRRQYTNEDGFKTYKTSTPEFIARYGVRWEGERNGLGLRTDLYAKSLTASEYDDGGYNYRLGGATTLNLTAGVSFGAQKQFSFDAGIYNIFDKKYQEMQSIYEPSRYFSVKLNARY